MIADRSEIVRLLGLASRTLYPTLIVRPGGRRGRVTLRRYTNIGMAEVNVEVRVCDLVALEHESRVRLHRGPVRSLAGDRQVAYRQILLAWHPRWFPSESAKREAEANATPWTA